MYARMNNQSLTVSYQYHRDKLNDLVSMCILFYVCISYYSLWTTKLIRLLSFASKNNISNTKSVSKWKILNFYFYQNFIGNFQIQFCVALNLKEEKNSKWIIKWKSHAYTSKLCTHTMTDSWRNYSREQELKSSIFI